MAYAVGSGRYGGELRWLGPLLIVFVLLMGGTGCDRPAVEDEGEPADEPVVGVPETGWLALPTRNEALLEEDAPQFYQYVDRTFEGRRSQPWQAGMYGFVRNPFRTGQGVVYRRSHEGIDIKPVYRGESGAALDTVRAIDQGEVVYANTAAGRSNYGKYVVVEHQWNQSPFYSLYAHLSDVNVQEGERVQQGDQLGIMGHTGRGLSQQRAHVHLEVGMLVTDNFQQWFEKHYPGAANHHGLYSGLNLVGMNPAALYQYMQEEGDSVSVRRFVQRQEVFYRVRVPGGPAPDIAQRYPWLLPRNADGQAPGWEISFTETGLPVQIQPVDEKVTEPYVSWVQFSEHPYRYRAEGFLAGSGDDVHLSRKGRKFIDLYTVGRSGAGPATAELHMTL